MGLVSVPPIEWLGDRVRIIDQTRLPHEEVYLELDDYRSLAAAIKELKIRGAPAIGVAAGYAVVLGAREIEAGSPDDFRNKLHQVSQIIAATRPTARNLFRAIERMESAARTGKNIDEIKEALISQAAAIQAEEVEATERLSQLGADLIGDGFTILTHCNAGPLATAGYGTALGVIIEAHRQGKRVEVLAGETRPLLQGARLTTWELRRADIPVTLITDSMAGYFMKSGQVDCVLVGADRITANGDAANKIGTYTLAVLARENNLPFYIAAPTTTVDRALASGDEITIEQRSTGEVTHIQGVSIAPEGIVAANPAFDVTPHRYITAIITERGIIREPYEQGLKGIV
ncbi:MAG: S-methyl-5-thioribose-1-phosphate isomerase [Chloroflexota bacterium]